MRHSKEIKIGLFCILVLAAMYCLLLFLQGKNFLGKERSYYAKYTDIEGLTVTSPVNILGIKAGVVDEIGLDKDGESVCVRMRINKRFRIPRNSTAILYSNSILGGKAIKLEYSKEIEYQNAGDTLKSAVEPDLISSLLEDINPLKEKLENTLENLNGTLQETRMLLDSTNRANLGHSLANLNATLGNLKVITETFSANKEQIDNTLSNVEKLSAKIEGSAGSITSTINNLESVTHQLKNAQLDTLTTRLSQLTAKLQDPNGNVGRLLSDHELYSNLNSILGKIDSLVTKIAEKPKKYLKVSVF